MSEVEPTTEVRSQGAEVVNSATSGHELEAIPKRVPTWRKAFDWIAGLSLIALGIVGLFLPVLQGILLIGLGLMVLSSHSRIARKLLDRLKKAGHDIKARVARRKGDSSDEKG